MRTIRRGAVFRKDYKRESRGRFAAELEALLEAALRELAFDRPLPARMRDHALVGEWRRHRDCHLKPDLVLIYRLEGDDLLHLVRLGSHSELGL